VLKFVQEYGNDINKHQDISEDEIAKAITIGLKEQIKTELEKKRLRSIFDILKQLAIGTGGSILASGIMQGLAKLF
jgi:hypothetical protein